MAQTFIRNAAGRALVDSPALNANSRAVLAPLARAQLPTTTVAVAGPGPIEPHSRNQFTDASPNALKVEPNVPPQGGNTPGEAMAEGHNSAGDGLVDEDAEGGVDGDGDDDDIDNGPVADPYANLDGAFGGYLADQPQPMTGRQTDINDLDNLRLF